jgi:hypothetical protein
MAMRVLRSVCTLCGFTGAPSPRVGGSILIEIVLWCFFLIPGLIYSLWRLGSKDQVCPSCQRPAMIPAFSPKGEELVNAKGGWSANAETFFVTEARRQWRGGLIGPVILSVWTIFSFAEDYNTCGAISALILAGVVASLVRSWPRQVFHVSTDQGQTRPIA